MVFSVHLNIENYILKPNSGTLKILTPFCLLLCWLPYQLSAQCNLAVNAGPDKYLCPDESVMLEGSISGDYDEFEWTPDIGLSDPFSLQPDAFQPGTYTLTATYNTGNNIIVNGDFSQGVSNFTSDYSLSTPGNVVTCPGGSQVFGPLGCEGTYDVLDDPSLGHSNFASCSDQSGDGNMMVVNGSATPNTNVWCQDVAVNPTSSYEFSAWVTSVVAGSPAILQFWINGVLLGNTFSPGGVCTWSEHTADWDADGASTAQICLINQNTSAGGNDFAVDNIQLIEICKSEDEVVVHLVEMDFSIQDPALLTCTNSSVRLSVQVNNQGSLDYSGSWLDPFGNTISAFPSNYEIEVTEPGEYIFIYVFDNGLARCEAFESVDVISDVVEVEAEAEVDGSVGCIGGSAFLRALNGGTFEYFWYSEDGIVIDDPTNEEIEVDESGYYSLIVTDPFTGCADTTEVFVPRSEDVPEAIIQTPDRLNCRNPIIILDAFDSNLPPDTDIFWSTLDGNFVDETDILDPEVDSAGIYRLILVNQTTGCSDTAEITVEGSFVRPVANLQDTLVLNCQTEIFELSLDDVDAQTSISWTTPSGPVDDSTSLLISEPGIYTVDLWHTESECGSADTIQILDDRAYPLADLDIPEVLNCDRDTVVLSASLQLSNPDVSVNWLDGQGNILINEEEWQASQTGWYIFNALNTDNGCLYRDSVEVGIDTIRPDVAVGDSIVFSCDDDFVVISGSSNSTEDLDVTWLNPDGSVLVRNEWSYEVRNTGTYTLIVENTTNGCTSVTTQTVTPDRDLPTLSVDSPDTLTCERTSITLSGNGSSAGGGTLDFQWLDAEGNALLDSEELEVSAPGSYTLWLTDASNGCSVSQLVEVSIDTLAPPISLDIPDTLSCKDSTVQLTLADFAPSFEYEWSSNDGQMIQRAPDGSFGIVSESGVYTVSVFDPANGCASEEEILVEENFSVPILDLEDVDPITCRDTIAELNLNIQSNNPYSIEWFDASGTALSRDIARLLTSQTGSFEVRVRDLESGCSTNEFFDVWANNDTLELIVEVPLDLDCENEEVKLEFGIIGNADFESVWYDRFGSILGRSGNELNVDQEGNYYLAVTNNENGCISRTKIEVERVAERPDTLLFEVLPAVCDAEFGTVRSLEVLGGTAPYSLYLNGNNISTGTNPLSVPIGFNELRVVDDRNCELVQGFDVPQEAGVYFELPPEYEIELGDRVKLIPRFARGEDDISSIRWELADDLSCTDCLEPWASPIKNIEYTLFIEDNKGCSHRSATRIRVNFEPGVFVSSAFSPNGDGINDYFFPQSQSKWIRSIGDFRIYSRWGEEVFWNLSPRINVADDGWDGTFDGKPLDPAVFVYYFEVEFINGEKRLFKGDITLVR